MGRMIDADRLKEIFSRNVVGGNAYFDLIDSAPTVEAILKDQYETRLKADMVAMLTDIQLEIKELWDNRYDVWLDNQYYIGKSDTLGEVDDIIQQKIDALKSKRGTENG